MAITYTGPSRQTISSTSFTADIGAAAADRIVLVSLAGVPGGGGAPTFSSATINGVSATLIVEGHSADDHIWFYAVVPTGSGSQTISFTLAQTLFEAVATVYVLSGADTAGITSQFAFDDTFGFQASTSITVTDGGAIFTAASVSAIRTASFASSTELPNVSDPITTAQRRQYALDLDGLSAGTFTTSQDTNFCFAMSSVAFAAAESGSTDALTADDLQSVSEVSQPVIGQTHSLNAGDIQAASSVTQPTMGQTHGLAADDLESASSVTTPVIGQTHVITADDVQAVSQVSQPVIGQVHSLAADDLQSVATVSTPTLAEVAAGVDALLADDLDAASEVTSPALGQVHALSAASIEAVSTVSRPAVFDGTVQVLPGKGGVRDVVDRRKEKWQRRKEAEQAARDALAAAFDGPQEAQQEAEPETVAEKPKAAPVARRAAVPAFDATNLLRQVDALETRLIEQAKADDDDAAALLLLMA